MQQSWLQKLWEFVLSIFTRPEPPPVEVQTTSSTSSANDALAWERRGISFRNDTATWNASTQSGAVAALNRIYQAFYARYGNAADVERSLDRIIGSGLALKMAAPIHKTDDSAIPNISTAGYDGIARCINLEYALNDNYAGNVGQSTVDRLGNLLIHEVGHIVCERLDHFSQRDPWVGMLKATADPPPSNYAPVSPTEDFAESFAAWVNHSPGNNGLFQTAYSPVRGPDNNPGPDRLRLVVQAVDQLK